MKDYELKAKDKFNFFSVAATNIILGAVIVINIFVQGCFNYIVLGLLIILAAIANYHFYKLIETHLNIAKAQGGVEALKELKKISEKAKLEK